MKHVLAFLFFVLTALPVFATTNLNTASTKELEDLPGVGPKVAADIEAARPFKSVDDLKNVKGIGKSKFEKLKDLVDVGATAAATPATTHAKTIETTTTKTVETVKPSKAVPSSIVDLNSASKEELEALPGIGPKKAEAIIAARPFNTIEDVMKVKGIKQGIFAKIKPYITVK